MNVLAPILITGCTFMASGQGNNAQISTLLDLRFENVGKQTLTKIVWRSTTVAGTYDSVLTGHFASGVVIVRRVIQNGTVRPKSYLAALEVQGPEICSVIATTSENGDTWSDPNATPADIFLPPVPTDDAPTVPSSFDNPTRDPIGVISCTFTILNGNNFKRAFGHVRFRNLAAQPISEIKFRALFGTAGIDFIKAGTFSPKVAIDTGDMRRKDLPPNAYSEYLSLDSPKSCATVSARFADGSIWTNPDVTLAEPPFPDRPYMNSKPPR